MAQAATPYSYTERKRIRKSFGKREHVLDVPYLLTMQREAYVAFLQKDLPPSKRKPEGLQAAFLSAFPIVSHNSMVEMKFIERKYSVIPDFGSPFPRHLFGEVCTSGDDKHISVCSRKRSRKSFQVR